MGVYELTNARPKVIIKSPKRFLINKENRELRQKIVDTLKYPRPRQGCESYSRLVCGYNWENVGPTYLQTYAATEDQFLFTLLRAWEVVKLENGRKTLCRKYPKQTIGIIIHHAKSGNVKDFIINDSDIRGHLRDQLSLENIGGTQNERDEIVYLIISNAVRRLFEELDLEYYHNHLVDIMKWRMEP
jgi:hypothetical protein